MRYNVDDLSKRIGKKKNRKKRIGQIIYIVLVFFFIINIALVLQSTFNPKKVPNILGYKAFTIITRKYGA